MRAYTVCLLALATFSSARPNPAEGGGGGREPGRGPGQFQGYHTRKWEPEAYKKAGEGGESRGSPATTAFPTLSSPIGGYGGAGTGTGGYQPPAATSSASGGADSGPGSTGTSSTSNTTSGGPISKGKITLPAGCESVNGIGFGWLPDYNGASLKVDEAAVGNTHPCFVGYYGQTGLSGWNDGAQITDNIADAQSGGKPYPIFVASVMPQGTPFDQFTTGSAVVTSIANAMKILTAAGLTVYLRFAHEMNCYISSSCGGGIYTGSTEDFQNAWGVVSAAVQDIDGVYMYWSPNYDSSAADLVSSGWYPTQGTVDIVGMDIYPAGGSSFTSIYQNFCQHWPDIPFVIGETGSAKGGSTSDKHAWLEQLTGQSALQACPNYLGVSWFEYLKGGTDFRIATEGNTAYEGVL